MSSLIAFVEYLRRRPALMWVHGLRSNSAYDRRIDGPNFHTGAEAVDSLEARFLSGVMRRVLADQGGNVGQGGPAMTPGERFLSR